MKIYRRMKDDGGVVVGYIDEYRKCSFSVPATGQPFPQEPCSAFVEREALISLGKAMDLNIGEALPDGVVSTEEHLPPEGE